VLFGVWMTSMKGMWLGGITFLFLYLVMYESQ